MNSWASGGYTNLLLRVDLRAEISKVHLILDTFTQVASICDCDITKCNNTSCLVSLPHIFDIKKRHKFYSGSHESVVSKRENIAK